VGIKIAAGDWVLMVGPPRAPADPLTTDPQTYTPGSEKWDLRQLNSVTEDAGNNETVLTWDEGLGYIPYRHVVVDPDGELFVLRERAALFGYDAINWNVLANDVQDKLQPPPSGQSDRYKDWINAEINNERRIDLDREYPQIEPGSWVVLMSPSYRELYRVLRVETVNRSDYLMSRQVTRLYLDSDENFQEFGLASGDPLKKLRQTVVLHTSQALSVASRITPTSISGASLRVVEDVSTLGTGRRIMVRGPTADQGVQGEVVTVREIIGEHDIVLETGLQNQYVRSQTAFFANVVEATQGETVADEILGNGDASIPFQTFELSQAPLTFVPRAGAAGGAASTLEVRVNGVKWHEATTFYGRNGNEAIFTTDLSDGQTTRIRLGDGKTGALASSGRNNVTASYRKGIGAGGNLPAKVIKTLLERPKGLESGFNPLPSSGGTDPESSDRIRRNAPNTVRTFGRIVSLRDFEDAARAFTGVAKARAFIQWDGEWRTVKLVVAGQGGAEIVNPQYQTLVNDLNSRRDPNRKLSVFNHCPVELALSVLIYPHRDYLPQAVSANVKAALETYFGFDRLELGQSIPLSEVYHTIHQAEGVIGAEVTRFKPLPSPACKAAPSPPPVKSSDLLQQVVRIEPYELARLDTTSTIHFQLTTEASGP
jgi:hypothetical protein